MKPRSTLVLAATAVVTFACEVSPFSAFIASIVSHRTPHCITATLPWFYSLFTVREFNSNSTTAYAPVLI